MKWSAWAWLALGLCGAVGACGEDERPASVSRFSRPGDGGHGNVTDPVRAGEGGTEDVTGGEAGAEATAGSSGADPDPIIDIPDGCLTGDTLNPHEVYVMGPRTGCDTLISHPSCRHIATAAIDCDGHAIQLAPDGRVLYLLEGELHQYECDECEYTYQEPTLNLHDLFVNDEVLESPCADRATRFLASPEGKHLFVCSDTSVSIDWLDADGNLVYSHIATHELLLHLGYGGYGLTEDLVVDLKTGATTEIVGLPVFHSQMASRAVQPDKFLLAIRDDYGEDQLWEIEPSGMATMLGVYPDLPTDVTAHDGVLDPSGALFQTGSQGVDHVIFRRTLDGAVANLNVQEDTVIVGVHEELLTGP